jgi:UDP-N-acetyl-alpha-D-muramoyl-L-alanyl-L-glutamate epimerase
MTLAELRQRYPRFIYQSCSCAVTETHFVIEWEFVSGPDLVFHPTTQIPLPENQDISHLSPGLLQNLAFQLGMAELMSYWKATSSPVIEIAAGYLNPDQLEWWKALLFNGMGEFFFRNEIDFTQPDFLTLVCTVDQSTSENEDLTENPVTIGTDQNKVIIPIGGGKDSVVTAQLITAAGHWQPQAWAIQPDPSNLATATAAGFKELHSITRTLDPRLFQLKKEGYLNGHIPFSSMVAFTHLIAAALHSVRYIALSNESSANEANVTFHGRPINHQYSKSFQFEQDFREYVSTYLVTDIEYFSFLRPLHELQIAKLFAEFPHQFSQFRSCNVGLRKNIWCHHCPKCLFAFLILFPFIEPEILTTKIFQSNLYEDESLKEMFLDLTLPGRIKPFECVGTYEENRAAAFLATQWYHRQQLPLPTLLQAFEQAVLPEFPDTEQTIPELLNGWIDQHNLPDDFAQVLQSQLKAHN